MSFSVWLTGPDEAAVLAMADEIGRRLSARTVPHEVIDRRTPGTDALAGNDLTRAVAFLAGVLARHGVATIVAVSTPARATRERVRAELRPMIEVHVRPGQAPGPGYEPPECAEVEVAAGDPARGAEQVLRTLEVLELLPRSDDRAYSDEEEREVIRRLKAFGYL